MEQNPMKSVNQRGRRRAHTPAAMQRIKQALLQAAGRRSGGMGPGSMPSTTTKAKGQHQVFTWALNNRQALINRALALGVLEAGKTPLAVGKHGKGQFRSWKTLAAAVERADRGVQVDEPISLRERAGRAVSEAAGE